MSSGWRSWWSGVGVAAGVWAVARAAAAHRAAACRTSFSRDPPQLAANCIARTGACAGLTPPVDSRRAPRFEPSEPLAHDARRMARRTPRGRARDLRRARPLDHLRERQPRHRLPLQRESLSGMFPWLQLLLRTPHAPVPRLGSGDGFRAEDRREDERAGAAAQGALAEVVEGRHDHLFRSDGRVPAPRGGLRDYASVHGGPAGVSQSGRHRHQGRVDPPRPRSPGGSRARPRRASTSRLLSPTTRQRG